MKQLQCLWHLARSRVESAVSFDRAFTLWEHIVVRLYTSDPTYRRKIIFILRGRDLFSCSLSTGWVKKCAYKVWGMLFHGECKCLTFKVRITLCIHRVHYSGFHIVPGIALTLISQGPLLEGSRHLYVSLLSQCSFFSRLVPPF